MISPNWWRQCLSSETNQKAGNGEFVWVYFKQCTVVTVHVVFSPGESSTVDGMEIDLLLSLLLFELLKIVISMSNFAQNQFQ